MTVLLAAMVLAGLGAWLAHRALPAPAGCLGWDGRQWRWHAGGAELSLQRVVVALDLGGCVLLHLFPRSNMVEQHTHVSRIRPFWRIAASRSAQGAWHGLRLALAAHAGAPSAAVTDEVQR
jgi:hypothetical protein